MPELPDITVYIEALEQRISGHTLTQAQIASPFLLRTIEPPVAACVGHKVSALRRVGKRIAIGFDNDMWLVLHLMIAGRLHWFEKAKKPDGRRTSSGVPVRQRLPHADRSRIAKARVPAHGAGEAGLAALDPGGMDVMTASLDQFTRGLTVGNHTLKRALTDPHVFSGIGNAYSDEILHRARLSPITLTSRLTADEISRLHARHTRGITRMDRSAFAPKPPADSPKRSPRSAQRWPSMDATGCPAPAAAPRSSASATLRTRPTTARCARPEDAYSPIAR